MADFGVKVLKEGTEGMDALTPITPQNKKDWAFLTTDPILMIRRAFFIVGGTYTHNLGHIPEFDVYEVDDVTTPTEYIYSKLGTPSTTDIVDLPDPCYLIIYVNN